MNAIEAKEHFKLAKLDRRFSVKTMTAALNSCVSSRTLAGHLSGAHLRHSDERLSSRKTRVCFLLGF
jgi:hypothetical protein